MTECVLETTRLRLECFELADADFIVELVNDPAFIEHIGDKGVRMRDDAVRYLEQGPLASYADHGFGLWRVRLKEGGETIGMCGLLKRETLEHADLGYAFLPAYRGMGYAFEAAAGVVNLAETGLGLERILAIVTAENWRSKRLLEKLAFRFERRVRLQAGEGQLELYAWESVRTSGPKPQ